PAQENKEEHTLPAPQGSLQFEPTPTPVLVSEQVIVQEPPVKELEPPVEKTQPGELKDQGVTEVRPNPETTNIEA
ncbi:hypothetical protein A2U01_0102651, partial [Trifolium medium]|nr:hypothetical protein [Trifolium medium]